MCLAQGTWQSPLPLNSSQSAVGGILSAWEEEGQDRSLGWKWLARSVVLSQNFPGLMLVQLRLGGLRGLPGPAFRKCWKSASLTAHVSTISVGKGGSQVSCTDAPECVTRRSVSALYDSRLLESDPASVNSGPEFPMERKKSALAQTSSDLA